MSSKEYIIDTMLSKAKVTNIDNQPNHHAAQVTLEKELIKIAMSVSTALGGGHLDAEYAHCTNGIHFVVPAHPGIYPQNITAATKSRRKAKHKELNNVGRSFLI
jgi:hypothetical protein